MSDANPTVIYPGLYYEDADSAIEWIERTLGFERGEVHRDPEGAIVHAELTLGPAVLMLGSAGIGREPFRSEIRPGGTLIYLATDDVEGLYSRAREAGADVAMEISDTDYGSRDFTLRDPEGNLWSFGTYRPSA
jgi:uncharacterized glyoxalase superfamily protein PhnB